MRSVFSLAILALGLGASVHAASVDLDLSSRAVDCSSYGTYEPFTGPCEATNCGARGINCLNNGYSGCVGFPNLQCPFKGCACTRY